MDATQTLPQLFKGIALFTPGGDLTYCIDPDKQKRWHLHLCAALQDLLGLKEPPHFLVPCYTATIDRWLEPHTQQVKTWAELHPFVLRHQNLLDCIFSPREGSPTAYAWQVRERDEETCDPMVLATYRRQFPELWESHDLIARINADDGDRPSPFEPEILPDRGDAYGYVLRLFVSGRSSVAENVLSQLHRILEESLGCPYTLKVIDILKHPQEAEINNICATPTLVKVWPRPVRRIVGELNRDRICQILGYLRA